MEDDVKKEVEKILDSLSEKQKALLPGYNNPKFPYALSIVLYMKGWNPEDIVKLSTKICKSNFKNKLFQGYERETRFLKSSNLLMLNVKFCLFYTLGDLCPLVNIPLLFAISNREPLYQG